MIDINLLSECPVKVHDLFNVYGNGWTFQLIFPIQGSYTSKLPLLITNKLDSWFWIHNSKGQFNSKSAYREIVSASFS